jgi:Flp pilus assembly protein TadB
VVVLKPLATPGSASPEGTGTETDLVRLRAAAGVDLGDPDRLPPRARRAVAVATAVGAPLLDALDGAAAAEADARGASRAVGVASAQTRAVAGGLLLAPVLLVPGLGRLVGADLAAFYTSPIGMAVGVVGVALLGVGAALIATLVRRVGRPKRGGVGRRPAVKAAIAGAALWWIAHPAVGALTGAGVLWWTRRQPVGAAPRPGFDEVVDLAATALTGGVAPPEALRVAASHLPVHAPELRRLALELELGLEPAGEPAARDDGLHRLRIVMTTAVTVGAPVAPALRRLARDLRADDLARILAAAERLPAQLTFPTALCLLPATLLLVGAPMVHAGLAAAAA